MSRYDGGSMMELADITKAIDVPIYVLLSHYQWDFARWVSSIFIYNTYSSGVG